METQAVNKLILGDNLEILKTIDSETVDLIYLDPPFFSNRTYEVVWGDSGEVRSFEDRFSGGIDHYISWLKERVIEMHRVLKSTGSIFLHCDHHANSYIRVQILDKVFGINNFRNEIIWCYAGPGSPGTKQFLRKHDTIFWYSKSMTGWTFNVDKVRFEHSAKTIENFKEGLIGSGFGGAEVPRELNSKGKVPEDFWTDIAIAARFPKGSENNIGYPTQKPIKLLERIINAGSSEEDLILDPFVGGGTTIAVADKLNRRWIGIDQSVQAVKVTEFRLNHNQDMFSKPFVTQLHKYDYDTLRYKDAFEFESWIVTQFGGSSNTKQRSDLGLDGKTKDNTPIQVKRSDNVGRNVVDNFLSAVQRYDKALYEKNKRAKQPVGFIIAFSFGKGAVQETARLKNDEDVMIKLITVEEIVPIAKKPALTVQVNEAGRDKKDIREIEFIATAQSIVGIEFYAWDFAYQADKGFKPQVLIDKEGKQKYKFKAGQHNIAVKVVDNDGLDNIEVIKLKVNGTIERTG